MYVEVDVMLPTGCRAQCSVTGIYNNNIYNIYIVPTSVEVPLPRSRSRTQQLGSILSLPWSLVIGCVMQSMKVRAGSIGMSGARGSAPRTAPHRAPGNSNQPNEAAAPPSSTGDHWGGGLLL